MHNNSTTSFIDVLPDVSRFAGTAAAMTASHPCSGTFYGVSMTLK
jgi:hypothetical protein